jgi:hypothetical protein
VVHIKVSPHEGNEAGITRMNESDYLANPSAYQLCDEAGNPVEAPAPAEAPAPTGDSDEFDAAADEAEDREEEEAEAVAKDAKDAKAHPKKKPGH